MEEFRIKQHEQYIRIKRKMKKLLISLTEKQDKQLVDAFDYHMQLARNELFEEFQNEKFKLAYNWEKELEILREKNQKELVQLRKSLETKHAQDLIELKQCFEIKNKATPVKVDYEVEEKHEVDESILHSILQIKKLDKELRKRNGELLVYKERLNYILNGYIGFILKNLKANTKLRKNKLNEAYILLKNVSKTESRIINEYENPSCV